MNSDENCVQIILFYGSRGDLVMKMAKELGCDEGKASDFINKYFHFLTEDLLDKIKDEIK